MTSPETVTVEDDDDEVVLVRVNTGIVDLTSDQSSDEECQPTVNVVPKPKVEVRQKTLSSSETAPKKIKHTLISIKDVVVPFIFRGEQQLVEKNLVEELLFFRYFRVFSDELIQCMTPVLFMLSPEEKTYFTNLHNHFKCSGAVSNILFVKEDVEKMLIFLDNCYEMLVQKKPKFNICGFVKVLGTLIPFIMHNWFKFMPLFYFENDSELGKKLSRLAATFSNPWVLSYIKLCCKLEGVREQFYLKNQLKLVNLNSLVKNLPDGTRVDIFWPDTISDVVFRPDYLKSLKEKETLKSDNTALTIKRQCKENKGEPNTKKRRKNLPNNQDVGQKNASVNDIKVTIENVMTVPEESFDDKDTEFDESNQNQNKNQNVIVIRANDTVPIQMSLNVGPTFKASQSKEDEILASHNQMLFNPNLHSENRYQPSNKEPPVILNKHLEQKSWSTLQKKYKIQESLSYNTSVEKIKAGPSATTLPTHIETSWSSLQTNYEIQETLAQKPSVEKIKADPVTTIANTKPPSICLNQLVAAPLKPILSFQEMAEVKPISSFQQMAEIKPISSSQQMAEVSRQILNLAEPEFEIKTEIKQEVPVEITLEDIQSGSDENTRDYSTHANSPVISIASSTGDNLVDFDDAIVPVPVSLVAVQQPEMKVVIPTPQKTVSNSIEECSNVPEPSMPKGKHKPKKSVFSSPITTINTQAEPYPVMQVLGRSPVPSFQVPNNETNALSEASGSMAMVMPKIVNSYSVKDVTDQSTPSFIRIEGAKGSSPPPVMIINKAETQSILFRVTQLEEDPNSFTDSDYLIRQVHIDGSKFHCINLNPGRFTQWLISVSEIEAKLFDTRTSAQDLIKSFFHVGLELFRLNNNQKTTFQLFKDSSVFKYMHGLYVNLDEFDTVYGDLKMTVSENTSHE